MRASTEPIFVWVPWRTGLAGMYSRSAVRTEAAFDDHETCRYSAARRRLGPHGRPGTIALRGLREYFRDVSDHLQRLNQTTDSIRDTIATAISVNLSMITLQESETMKRLAAYAALVAVPTMIAGIYGMNFQHMPELSWRYGYELALIVMAGLDGYLFYRLRKAKWL
jgi:hypothetical protein